MVELKNRKFDWSEENCWYITKTSGLWVAKKITDENALIEPSFKGWFNHQDALDAACVLNQELLEKQHKKQTESKSSKKIWISSFYEDPKAWFSEEKPEEHAITLEELVENEAEGDVFCILFGLNMVYVLEQTTWNIENKEITEYAKKWDEWCKDKPIIKCLKDFDWKERYDLLFKAYNDLLEMNKNCYVGRETYYDKNSDTTIRIEMLNWVEKGQSEKQYEEKNGGKSPIQYVVMRTIDYNTDSGD